MSVLVQSITVDCAEPYALSQFWEQVTGYHEDPEDPNAPDHELCLLVDPAGGPGLLFIKVPDGKATKNRLHLDLRPTDVTRDEEVERVLKLGASLFEDHRNPDGTGWVTLADPEGNEFCIVRSAAERV